MDDIKLFPGARCFGYCRAVPGLPRNGFYGITYYTMEEQKRIITEYAESYKIEVDGFFEDTCGNLDKIGRRPAGKILMSHIRANDHVIVTSLDRWFCSFKAASSGILWIKRKRINFHVVFYHEGCLYSESPGGYHLFRTIKAMKEMALGHASERYAKRNVLAKASTGEFATPISFCVPDIRGCPLGYIIRTFNRNGKSCHRKIKHKREQEQMQLIFDWVEQGWDFDKISNHLNTGDFGRQNPGYPYIARSKRYRGKELPWTAKQVSRFYKAKLRQNALEESRGKKKV